MLARRLSLASCATGVALTMLFTGLLAPRAAGVSEIAPHAGEAQLADAAPAVAVRSAADLIGYYERIGYDLAAIRAGTAPVPRVQPTALPRDLRSVESAKQRKTIFIRTVLPLVLAENDRILEDRRRLAGLIEGTSAGTPPAAADRAWLDERATHYRVDDGDLGELMRRMDIVPPSLALAQSAEESGWGTSRFARDGHALFGQQAARPDTPQMAPLNGADYRIRAFRKIGGSVATYIRNLNTHPAYRGFREARAAMRAKGGPIDGGALLGTLTRYSERGADYIAAVRTIMRQNRLHEFDRARLTPSRHAPLLVSAG